MGTEPLIFVVKMLIHTFIPYVLLILMYPLLMAGIFFMLQRVFRWYGSREKDIILKIINNMPFVLVSSTAILFAAVLYSSLRFEMIGKFGINPLAIGPLFIIGIAIGVVAGGILFFLRGRLSLFIDSLGGHVRKHTRRYRGPITQSEIRRILLLKKSKTLILRKLSRPSILPLIIAQSFFEEFIWRAYLITAFFFGFGWNMYLALFISSLAFGSIHYRYGIQEMILQAINGFAFGVLFIFTDTLWAPAASHIVYNFLSVRAIRLQTQVENGTLAI
jgi:membrane protease YdiL (CAAX protease family)